MQVIKMAIIEGESSCIQTWESYVPPEIGYEREPKETNILYLEKGDNMDENYNVPNKDENDIEPKLVSIDRDMADRYKEALEHIGYSTGLSEFNVDSRGYSPEIAEELGKDYLDNRIIIASGKQLKEISLVSDNHDCLYGILENVPSELVDKITPYESLVGELNLFYNSRSITSLLDESFEAEGSMTYGFYIKTTLETPTGAVAEINKLNNKMMLINKNKIENIDRQFYRELLTDILPLNERYGSIEDINRTNNVIIYDSLEDIFSYSHKGSQLIALNNSDKKAIVCPNNLPFDLDRLDLGSLEVLCYGEKSRIFDSLLENNFLSLKEDNLVEQIEEIAREAMKTLSAGSEEMSGFEFYRVFKQKKDDPEFIQELKNRNWHTLRDFKYGRIDFKELPVDLKLRLTEVNNNNEKSKELESLLDIIGEKEHDE